MKLIITLAAVLLALPGLLDAAERKPNILIIVGDDMGYADVGFHGCKDIPTPNLDMPFIVSWPGHVKPGVYEQPAIQLDLHTTALAAAGVEVKPDWKLDGVNLLPFLSGESDGMPHEALYWRLGEQMALRAGDFKIVRYDTNAETQTGQRGGPVTDVKLYNLRDDIGETKDLAAAMPDKVSELQTKWNDWNATLVKPLWGSGARESESAAPRAAGKKNRAGRD